MSHELNNATQPTDDASASSFADSSTASVNVHVSNDELFARIHQLESLVLHLQQSASSSSTSSINSNTSNDNTVHHVKPSKPSTFSGEIGRSAQLWLLELEFFFTAAGVDNNHRTAFAAAMLKDEALSWLASTNITDPHSVPWNDFKSAFLARFNPVTTSIQSRAELLQLKQSGSINQYINTFQSILHRVTDMSETDKIFFFIRGASSSLRAEIVKRAPKTLQDAINTAVSRQSVNMLADNITNPSALSYQQSNPSRQMPPSSSIATTTISSSQTTPPSSSHSTSSSSDAMQLDIIDRQFDNDNNDQPPAELHAAFYNTNNNRHSSRFNNPSGSSFNSTLICRYCRKRGHSAQHCRSLIADSQHRSSSSSSSAPPSSSSFNRNNFDRRSSNRFHSQRTNGYGQRHGQTLHHIIHHHIVTLA